MDYIVIHDYFAPVLADPLTALAIAAAGANAITGLVGSFMGRKNNQDNIAAQRAANEANIYMTEQTNASNERINEQQMANALQLQRNEQMWNSEAAQALRMRAAGLNPNNQGVSSSTIGSASNPSLIPNQAAHVEPVQSDITQSVEPLSEGLKNASDSFLTVNQGIREGLGNQYTVKTMADNVTKLQSELALLRKQIENQEQDTALKRRLTTYYDYVSEQVDYQNALVHQGFNDILNSRKVQNQFMQNQSNAQAQLAKLYGEQVISEGLDRLLKRAKNQREAALASAQIKDLLASAFQRNASGLVSYESYEQMKKSFDVQFEKLKASLDLDYATLTQFDTQRGFIEQQLEHMRKENQSYWFDKGFSWFGSYASSVRDIGIGLGSMFPMPKLFSPGQSNASPSTPPPLPSMQSYIDKHLYPNEPPRQTMSREEYIRWKRLTDPNFSPNF